MPGYTEIVSPGMRWEEMMGNDMLHLILDVSDKAGDINYYYYRILRNGKLFKWNVVRDLDRFNNTMQFDISCMSHDKAEKNDPDDYDSIFLIPIAISWGNAIMIIVAASPASVSSTIWTISAR